MVTKITSDVLDSHLKCKYKGHLKHAGEQGTKSEYEVLVTESRRELRTQAIAKLLTRHDDAEVLRGPSLSRPILGRGMTLILDGILQDDEVSLLFDGLKRVNGPSRLGDFHYIPILYYEGEKIRQEHRFLLALYGLMLSPIQGREPASGMIVHGDECRITKVQLTSGSIKKAQHILEEIKHSQTSAAAPRLMLNDHCKVCEFQAAVPRTGRKRRRY